MCVWGGGMGGMQCIYMVLMGNNGEVCGLLLKYYVA